ncbi:MAG: hypothetical protein ACREJ3_19035, partial [Polyangiaceae bacterium]
EDDDVGFPYSSYDLLDTSGRVLRHVQNHADDKLAWPAAPDLVLLAPGLYGLRAKGFNGAPVSATVRVVRGQTMIVNLDPDRPWAPPPGTGPQEVAHGPRGAPVGWLAADAP